MRRHKELTPEDKVVASQYRGATFVQRGTFNPSTLLWLATGIGSTGYFVTDLGGRSLNGDEIRVSQIKVERCLAGE